MPLDWKQIAAPLAQSNPCGENVRTTPGLQERYYRLKDARNLARGAERSVSPGEPLRLAPAWHEVDQLAREMLISDSKDIELLAWLAESQLRLNGFEGLRDVFTATAELFETHADGLHSIGDDDVEERLAPLAGLNGVTGEGTLIQPIRLTSLLGDGGFAVHTLWDYQLAQRTGEEARREELQAIVDDAGPTGVADRLQVVKDCIEAYERLTAGLNQRFGKDAPPSSNTRNILIEVAAAIRDLGGISEEDGASAQDEAQPQPEAGAAPAATPVRQAQPGAINSRDDAFEILLSVARYFRRTEPHSPISLAIETLVRRGRMDFSELLAELLPEAQARKAVLTAAGIQPKNEGQNT